MIKFKQWNCILQFGKYSNGRTAIQLIEVGTHELIAVATVNVPDAPIYDHDVIIKDYSENEGMYQCLLYSGIIDPVKRYINVGYAHCPVCELVKPEPTEPELEYPQ